MSQITKPELERAVRVAEIDKGRCQTCGWRGSHKEDCPESPNQSVSNQWMTDFRPPYTVGQLKRAIEHMDPDLAVFRFDFGGMEGKCEWKRKETYRQWVKRMLAEKKEESDG